MDEKLVGGKAYNLDILTKNGINVPKWFVVNSAEEYMLTSPQPSPKLGEGANLYAVRSSAVGEDGSGNSFAGQMESFLYVKPEDIKSRIQDVIYSANSDRIKFYREQNGLSNDNIKVGVVVQEMINSDVSGVAFSSNPITGKRNEIIISSVFGLGEGLVSGELNADTFSVEDKKITKNIAEKPYKIVYDEEKGFGTKQVENENPSASSLTDEQIKEIVQEVKKIVEIYGKPQDIEWAYEGAIAQIGFFEAENNIEAIKFLFDEIKKYAKSKGYDYLIGPINGSTWKKYRVTLPSNNPPFLLDNYNKPYYAELFENCGFDTIANYTSSICRNLNKDYSRLDKFGEIYEKKGVKIRKFDPEKFDEDIRKIYDVSVKSFVNNFLYTPIDFEDFYKMYEPVKTFLNPEWILLAENETNEPVAFIFGFDNLYNRSEKSLIIKTLAQVPDYKYRGIGSYLTEFIHKKAYLAGYENIIHALMQESNVSANILSGELYHEYKLYRIKL